MDKKKEFSPTLEEGLMEGLTVSQAFVVIEAVASCAIEGIVITRKQFKNLCKVLKEG